MSSYWKSDAMFKSYADANTFKELVSSRDLGFTSSIYRMEGSSIYTVTYMTDDERYNDLIQVINEIRRDYVKA